MREGWEYKKLGEIIRPAKVVKNGEKKDLPILSITMHDGIVLQASRFKKTIASVDTSTYKVVKNGQLVIAFPIDEGLIYTQDIVEAGIMSPAYNIWDVDFTNINRQFLTIYLHCPYAMNYYKSKLRGTTMRRRSIPREDLLNMPLPVPSLSTQESIVSELDKINELISLKKEQLKDYDNLAQSIFYDMFGDPVTNEKGWEVKPLGTITKIGTGSTPNRKVNSYYAGNNPWIKSTEVCNCIIHEAEEYISDEAIKETNCTLYPENTILMAMYGQGKTRGQIAILKIVACTNQAVAAIMPSNKFAPTFIFHHLHIMYDNIRSMARGGNQANLNLSLVKSIKTILPPLPLQQAFAKRIEAIEQQKQLISSEIKDLETLLASRMQYWFD